VFLQRNERTVVRHVQQYSNKEHGSENTVKLRLETLVRSVGANQWWSLIGVKRNFWLAKFLTSRHVRTHRVIFYISNMLRNWWLGLRV